MKKIDLLNFSQLDESLQTAAGLALIANLGLKSKGGKVITSYGEKTPAGLALTIESIINNFAHDHNVRYAELIKPEDFERISSDSNGNPRYVLHFLRMIKRDEIHAGIDNKYLTALNRARDFGGRKFHNKSYGGGIVFQSYNINDLCDQLNEAKLK